MKKVASKITAIALLLALLSGLAACGTTSVHDTTGLGDQAEGRPTAADTPLPENQYKDAVDDAFVERYITTLDICLNGDNELIFDDPNLIPTQTLYMFFLYHLGLEQPQTGESYPGERWYKETDSTYHIPVSEIEAVLSSYFEDYALNRNILGGYNENLDEIVTPLISGFGGGRKINVTNKCFLSDDTVQITVDFLNDSGMAYCTKVYTLKLRDDGVTYLSILKSYNKAEKPVSIVGLRYGWIGYAQNKILYQYGDKAYGIAMSPGELLTTEYSTFDREKQIGHHRLTEKNYIRETYDEHQNIDALRISGTDEILWISGDYNPLPRPVIKANDFPGEYTNEIARRLKECGGEKTPINIAEVLRADIDGDGTEETFIVANSPRGENWQLINSEVLADERTVAQGHVVYSIILMEKGGEYWEVYSEMLSAGQHDYIDLYFKAEIAGLFDLDGDGVMEICLDTIHWDIPEILISRYNGSEIDSVMTCGFAW